MKRTILILIGAALIALLPSCQKTDEDVSKDVSAVSEPASVVSVDESGEESNGEVKSEYVKNIADYTVSTDKHGDLYIEKYNGRDPYIEIPATDSEGNAITMVYTSAFVGCDFIKGIKIGEGITSVGVDYNFNRDGWGDYTDELVAYGNGFCGCTSLEKLIIPDSVVYFGPMNNTAIVELTVPKNLVSLGWGNFASNEALKKVVFENPDYKLDIDEFLGCDAIEELILPANLTALPRGAITSCKALKTLYLPDGYNYEPMFLPSGCTFYVKKDSTAHKTLVEYNKRDGYEILNFEVVE